MTLVSVVQTKETSTGKHQKEKAYENVKAKVTGERGQADGQVKKETEMD